MIHSRPKWDVLHSIYAARGSSRGHFLDEDVVSGALALDLSLTKLLAMKICDEQGMEDLRLALDGPIYKSIFTLYRWYGPQEDHRSDRRNGMDAFTMSWTECVWFATESGLATDSKGDVASGDLTLDQIRTEFVVTNVELEAEADNDDDTLARFELVELLIRIAKLKFLKPGVVRYKHG